MPCCRIVFHGHFRTWGTLDLPKQNKTGDELIAGIAEREARVVVTKDTDFAADQLHSTRQFKLLLVRTGNIENTLLIDLFESRMGKILECLERNTFVEINRRYIVIHR